MSFISLQLSYISYHKTPKRLSITAPPRRPPLPLCLPMKDPPMYSNGSVFTPPDQRLRSITASVSPGSRTTNLSTCVDSDTQLPPTQFRQPKRMSRSTEGSDEYSYVESECLTHLDAFSSNNIDVWKRKLDTLLHDKDKKELVSREKKDRRDYQQIAALASRMDLYCQLYVKAVVVSKVPLPSYRFDLDENRPQREVILSPGLLKRVHAHLVNYISEKCTSRNMFSGSSSNATIVTDDLFENPEPFPHTKPFDNQIAWRKSLQMRDKQRIWQESTEGRKILEFRRSLPAFKEKDTILSVISQNQVVIISGETGCGKTTQIPQFILESEIESMCGATCNILCTQPRRLSVMSVSERIATERMETFGETVGYKVRLEGIKGRDTHLLFCTTGILLRRLIIDKNLKDVTHVIVDEIHERGINEDFLLVILRELLRPELRLILMSATLDADLFSSYFSARFLLILYNIIS